MFVRLSSHEELYTKHKEICAYIPHLHADLDKHFARNPIKNIIGYACMYCRQKRIALQPFIGAVWWIGSLTWGWG